MARSLFFGRGENNLYFLKGGFRQNEACDEGKVLRSSTDRAPACVKIGVV